MASIVINGFATFDRPLVDEELPTLASLPIWSFDMDLAPGRGHAELTRVETRPCRLLSGPKLARQHECIMRRDRG